MSLTTPLAIAPSLCCGAIGAVITAFFWSVEYHAVARSSPGHIVLCALSGAVFILVFLNCTSFTYREQTRDRGTPLVRWAITAISSLVISGLHCGGLLTGWPGLGALGLGIAAGWGAGWALGAPTEPTAKDKRWIACYGVALVTLAGHNPMVAEQTVRALGRIGSRSEPAIPTLLDMLKSPTANAKGIPEALIQIGPAATSAAAARSDKLLKDVYSKELAVRVRATMSLRRTGPLALDPLLESLESKEAQVRVAATRVVASLEPETQTAVVPALAKLVNDPEPSIRLETARVLATIGPSAKQAVPALLEVWKDESTDERLKKTVSQTLEEIDPSKHNQP